MPRIRVRLARSCALRHVSHQQYMKLVHDAVGRGGLPVARGKRSDTPFRITAGPPLTPGHTSRAEYADLELVDRITPWELNARLRAALPEGLDLLWSRRIPPRWPHLRASVAGFCYTIEGRFDPECVRVFHAAAVWPLVRRRKDRERIVDLKDCVAGLEMRSGRLLLTLNVRPEGTPKPEEILESVFDMTRDAVAALAIERTAVRFLPLVYPRAFLVETL